VEQAHLDAAVTSMLMLNRHASHLAREAGGHAVTDVTGFGILGHALEMGEHSGIRIVLRTGDLPLLPGALQYAIDGVDFGGVNRNREYLEPRVEGLNTVSAEMQRLLLDPQTSGGLLIALDAAKAVALVEALQGDGLPVAVIGEVREGAGLILEG
jgi:selenide,water dikinase